MSLEIPLAGLGSRFSALLIDLIIKLLMTLAVLGALLGIDLLFGDVSDGLFIGIIAVSGLVIYLGYNIAFEAFGGGRTPGKRRVGIRVLMSGGQPIGLAPAAVRNVLFLVDGPLTFYVLGLILVLATERNQRLGDIAADTIVARDGLQTAEIADLDDLEQPTSRWDVSAVTPEEVAVAREFLGRRQTLSKPARDRIAARLASGLMRKVRAPDAPEEAELFLERLVAAKDRD